MANLLSVDAFMEFVDWLRSVTYVRLLASILSLWTLSSTYFVAGRTLKLAEVLYRHGDRSPVKNYPSDPYTEDTWPGGFGQLTEQGMIQQYELGKWLRKRYVIDQGFLNKTYVRREMRVISTDFDRTIMSADSNLQGLYPRDKSLGKGTDLLWKPIPVFRLADDCDMYLHGNKACPRLRQLQEDKQMLTEQYIKDDQAFFDSVKESAGLDAMDLRNFTHVADALYFEKQDGRSLPKWVTDDVFQRLMDAMDFHYLITYCNKTIEYRKLMSGNLMRQIVEHLKNYTAGIDNETKLFMYSAHDVTVATLLFGLGFEVTRQPPTASCVLIEMYEETNGNYTVDIYFRNRTDTNAPYTLVMPGCVEHCPLEDFYDLTKNVIPKDLKTECKKKVSLQGLEWSNKGWMIAFLSVVLSLVLAFIMIALLLFSSHRRKQLVRERRMQPINFHLLGHHASESEEDESVFDT